MRRTQPSHPPTGVECILPLPEQVAMCSVPWRSGDRSSLTGLWTPRATGGLRTRRRARAAESARLEIVCGETHRGFKSHRLRHEVGDSPRPSHEIAICTIGDPQAGSCHVPRLGAR